MRNSVIARDPVAQAAGMAVVSDGATAVDMVLAAMLAGAARSSAASLLGAAGILVAGVGVGTHFIDGRARAPGVGAKRNKTPDDVPDTWTAAVPGFLEGVLAAHTRFATKPLSEIVRAAVSAVREEEVDLALGERLKFLQQLHRTGISTMDRAGVLRSTLNAVGPMAGGVFTKEDLVPVPAPIREMPVCMEDGDEVLLPPRRAGRYGPNAPDPLPDLAVESVIAMDRHGVIAVATWIAASAATALDGAPGLALPALMPKPKKGVPRWRPGAALPLPMPSAILLRESKAWAALGLCGSGNLVSARDAIVTSRLHAAGIALHIGDGSNHSVSKDTVALWSVREDDHGARTTVTSVHSHND
jgi:hypothetical protein